MKTENLLDRFITGVSKLLFDYKEAIFINWN